MIKWDLIIGEEDTIGKKRKEQTNNG